jgi:hypothetical protein
VKVGDCIGGFTNA